MASTSYEEAHKIRRALMWIFLIWVVSNHVVRGVSSSGMLSGSQSPGMVYGPADFMPNIQNLMLRPWNGFRVHLGDNLIGYCNYCPESARTGCVKTAEVLRVVLGLHQ